MITVNMVCTGNICRSAMAQIVLQQALEQAGLAGRVAVTSSGISSEEHGNPVDRRAARALVARGYPEGRSHRAHRITQAEIEQHDWLIAMTMGHVKALERRGANPDRVYLLRQFDPACTGQPQGWELDIDDPWYGGAEDFEHCLDQIEAAMPGLVSILAANADYGRRG
ncbi:MAG: low molecular weight phosphotyrosine protein phosphatase [Bifidobacteriaceae bacterium]|jgi:protein-tyrosine phosphatase|nr:low molecular weight phosphotyrosine protein phosphatase [Bifidobacteriaceae bacterium]